jgi:putative serine protease PepD
MTQTTNNENEHGYAWARRPGGSSEHSASPTAGGETQAVAAGEPGHAGSAEAADQQREQATPQGYQQATPQGQQYPHGAQGQGSVPADTTQTAPMYAGPATQTQQPTSAPSRWFTGDSFGHSSADSGAGGMPPNTPPVGRRQPRRPGWGGVIAVGAGAAVLSSLLTAGIVLQNQDEVTTTGTKASAPLVKAPVSNSSTASPDWGAVAKAVEPSVVAVQVSSQNGSGEGSGVILDKDGRIVTNNHVVAGAGEGGTVQVVLSDGRSYPATVVGTDPSTDLAVIKLTKAPANLVPAVLGDSDSVAVGDPVMAVGNPLGLAGTVTTGIVSATNRPTTTQNATQPVDPSTGQGDPVVTNAIQTDAAVNPGNSGGALVDSQGRVIGIPSSIASLGGSGLGQSSQSGNIGLGFAIPIAEAKDVTSQLIKGGAVSHAWLGVGPDDGTVTVDGASRDAAVLKDILKNGPAEKAGLKVGDAVIAVDNEPVNSALSLVGQLRERQAGVAVTLTVIRDGKATDVSVTLGSKPTTSN